MSEEELKKKRTIHGDHKGYITRTGKSRAYSTSPGSQDILLDRFLINSSLIQGSGQGINQNVPPESWSHSAGPLFVKRDILKAGWHGVYIVLYIVEVAELSTLVLYQTRVPKRLLKALNVSSADEVHQDGLSDNAKTFKTAIKLLLSLFELPEVESLFFQPQDLSGDLIWGSSNRLTRCVVWKS